MCCIIYSGASLTAQAQLQQYSGSGYPPAQVHPVLETTAVASTTNSLAYTSRTASGSLSPYDPFMDNHLSAPKTPQGVFGLPVREVEKLLREYGAKPQSYSFGKQSRMILAAYLITIQFDKARNVGGISVEPRYPVKIIGSNAQTFFSQLFMSGIDPSNFRTVITPEKISICYEPATGKK